MGCYAQTEMGHGSNVRGLETIATYIPETDEFDIHSPTLTSTKFWPGGLGCTATHALTMVRKHRHAVVVLRLCRSTLGFGVQAKMIIGGKDLGVQCFMVPLRSMTTHR